VGPRRQRLGACVAHELASVAGVQSTWGDLVCLTGLPRRFEDGREGDAVCEGGVMDGCARRLFFSVGSGLGVWLFAVWTTS
jgi:hypothetical protein